MSSESFITVQESSGRRRRPERQLYIPPAQRRFTSTREAENGTQPYHPSKLDSANGKILKTTSAQKKPRKKSNIGINKRLFTAQVHTTEQEMNSEIISFIKETAASEFGKYIPSLMDLIKLDLLSLPTYNIVFLKSNIPSLNYFHKCSCEFHQYLTTRFKNDLKLGIPIFHIDNNQILDLSRDKISWQTFFPHKFQDTSTIPNDVARDTSVYDIESNCDYNLTLNQFKLCHKIGMRFSSERLNILQGNIIDDGSEVEVIFKESAFSENNYFSCDSEMFGSVVDLTEFNLGHYFKINLSANEHFHVCHQSHNVKNCFLEVKRDLLSKTNKEKECEQKMPSEGDKTKTIEISASKKKEPEVIKISEDGRKPTKSEIKIKEKKNMESKTKCQHDEEIEIMRKTKENINRKTRPLMKYSDDNDDLLRIDKQDNVNNWEDLFDDEGHIQDELLNEIVHKVGKDMTIVKASEDYRPYLPKSTDDLDHVVEIYNFPPSLTTGDIIHAFNMFDSDTMYVVWVDETHALLVLGSSSQAQKAVEVKNPFIKVRPISSGSVVAMTAAGKYDLKPAMKRPQTNLQTARRLITTHLGTKSQVTREQRAMERESLRKAREQKKMMRQNEQDAWEGKIH
ncbi:uncharacterized protein LOC123322442 isoform X2 [Coccinella septempunctata]|nr:uncharacterized protein LOC123322442 isoform X2 [Coccinella septempunctata]